MSVETWVEQNEKYLEASLAWLRLKLQALLPKSADPVVATIVQDVQQVRAGWFGKRPVASPSVASLPGSTAKPLPASSQAPVQDKAIQDAASARDAAAQTTPPPALEQLAQEFGLSPFEKDILLLCSSVEFDSGIGGLIAKVSSLFGKESPTFGLAMTLFEGGHWDAMSPQRPLRNAKLVEVSQTGSTPLTLSALRADERVLAFLKGINNLDDRLNTMISEVVETDQAGLSASQQAVCDQLLTELHAAISDSTVPVVQLLGKDVATKLAFSSQACGAMGSRLFRIAAEALPTSSADIDDFARLWQRETCLLPVVLYVEAEELDGTSAEIQTALGRLLAKSIGLVFVGLRETALRTDVSNLVYEVGKPSPAEQFQAWTDALAAQKVDAPDAPEQLAGQFDLSLSELSRIVAQAAPALSAGQDGTAALWDRCCSITKPRLDDLAVRIDTKATWDDLVLPDEQTRLMKLITAQVRERYKVYNEWGFATRMNRGLGISALFAGESGTGKTMAAEVIANDLRLNLYRIDLSSVVSKYIGETEKNLRKLFDAAEQGGAILFFDEADALFGKRSEVKDSHDRYANVEINYLLQRMESFGGLSVLATNLKSSLDDAFMRRLRFVVNFPFPTAADRKRIWQKVLPAQTPSEELDFDKLSKINVTGASIQNIALNAAFLAAGNGNKITMPTLLSAAVTELRKLDRPVTEAGFR